MKLKKPVRPIDTYSGLFELFAFDKNDRFKRNATRLGFTGFCILGVTQLAAVLTPDHWLHHFDRYGKPTNRPLFFVFVAIFLSSFMLGFFSFLAMAVHSVAVSRGTHFLGGLYYTLRGTFLFVLLPCAILAVLLWLLSLVVATAP